MRQNRRHLGWSRISRSVATYSLFGLGSVIAYHVYNLNKRFSNLLSDAAVERENHKNSCFIPTLQTSAEAEIQNVIIKLLNVNQLMETLIRGPKYLGNDTNPWHLLRILSSHLHLEEHSRALKTLATTNYNVGLCQQIAQACELNVAVKLARIKGVNQNLFLQPPSYIVTTSEPVEDSLNTIISKLPTSSEHACASYFLGIAQQFKEKDKDEEFMLRWDPDAAVIFHPRNKVQIIELYLQALLQFSQSFENSNLMVRNGVLLALWRVMHNFNKESTLKGLCLRIIANISLFSELHLQIFQSGWVGLLAEFLGPENGSFNLAAGKALANMDESSRKYGIYDRSIYLFHPLYESDNLDTIQSSSLSRAVKFSHNEKWDIDVIFVHGLLGGVGWTWRQSELLGINPGYSYCWPKDWLPQDVPGLRILGVDYATSISHWKSRCPDDMRRGSIVSRADQVLISLKLAGVGRKPIVWIGHSMGGLLLKQLLVTASKSSDGDLKRIVENSKALLMLSVPHGGSSVATLNTPARLLLLPSVEVEELRKGSNVLDKLNSEFNKLITDHPMAIVSLIETKSTLVQPWGIELKFVEPKSADLLPSGEVHYVPLDHFEICKPLNRTSFVYQRLIKLILGVRKGSPPKDLVQKL